MEALIKVSSLEFTEDLFKKIGNLIKDKNLDITISVKDKMVNTFQKETIDEYWQRINASIKEIESGNGVTFTMEEFENFVNSDL